MLVSKIVSIFKAFIDVATNGVAKVMNNKEPTKF